MRLTPILIAALMTAACGDGGAQRQESAGSYGASSGPNPNLPELRNETLENARQQEEGALPAPPPPASGGIGNVYPSQAGETTPRVMPGAEGGRSSAATGASGDPAATDQAGAEAQGEGGRQTPP